MPIFQYKAYTQNGSQTAGTLEAENLRDAISKVKEKGLLPADIKQEVKKKLFKKRGINVLPDATRQLSTLLSSGVPLVKALQAISSESKGFWKNVITDLKEDVSSGASLSRAMKKNPQIFPEFYISMIGAGEAGGTLDKVLIKLADFLERQRSLKNKVNTALIYPTFMIGVGFIVLYFMFTFVIPKITVIFETQKASLPFITVILIALSKFFKNFWWLILIVIIFGIYAFRRLKQKKKIILDKLLMKMPGGVIQNLYFARFTRTLGFLLESGLPILKALRLSAKSIGNKFLEEKVMEGEQKVAEGISLSSSLQGFPPTLLQIISTGEATGKLAEVLKKTADSYENRFEKGVERMLSLMEPIIILVMGLIVGFIVFSILLPIFQLNQLIK